MEKTTQVTQETQTAQHQVPEKPKSLKIAQWLEICFGLIAFSMSLYVIFMLGLGIKDWPVYLLFIPTATFLLSSLALFSQNLRLTKLSFVLNCIFLIVSTLIFIYLLVNILQLGFISSELENSGLGGLAVVVAIFSLAITLIGLIFLAILLIISLLFLRKNLLYLTKVYR